MNSIAKPNEITNSLTLESLRRNAHRPPSASEQSIAGKLLELIQRDEIGLRFRDPGDCDSDWSDKAVIELIGVLLSVDRSFLIGVLEDSVSLFYPMQKLMEQHPGYAAKVEKWERKNGIEQGVNIHG